MLTAAMSQPASVTFRYLGTSQSGGETLLKRILNTCSQNYKKAKTENLMKRYMSSMFQTIYVLFVKVYEVDKIRFLRSTKAVRTLIILFKIKILSASPEKNIFLVTRAK